MNTKDNYIQAEMQRGKNKAENRDSFIASNYWLWVIVAFIAYPLASILSALTEGGHVFMRMKMTGAPFAITIIFTLLVAGLIEILSYFLGKGAVDDIQGGVFSKPAPDKAAFFIKIIGFIAIMSFGVYLSMSGAPLLNEKLRSHYTPPTTSFISIDSIANYYDAKIALVRSDIDAAKKTTWKGRMTKDAIRSMKASQAQVQALEEKSNEAIAAANADNQSTKEEWENETATNSSYAIGFAGLGEIIKVFCLLFIGIYDQGLSNEAAVFGGGGRSKTKAYGQQAQPIGFTVNQTKEQFGQHEQPPTPRAKIGFKMPEPSNDQATTAEHIEPDVWPHVATTPDEDWEENKEEILEMALKHANSSAKKWEYKLSINHGKEETNEEHRRKWLGYVKVIKKRLDIIS